MKLSNKILLAIVASITLVIISGAIHIKLKGIKYVDLEYEQSKKELADFQYMVVNNVERSLTIATASQSALEVKYIKDTETPAFSYHFVGDTLFIEDILYDREQPGISWTLYTSKPLKKVFSDHSNISFKGYDSVLPMMDLTKTRVYIETNSIDNLVVKGNTESHISLVVGQIDTLDVQLDNSDLTMRNDVSILTGSIQNRSSMYIKGSTSLNLKVDKSSQLYH